MITKYFVWPAKNFEKWLIDNFLWTFDESCLWDCSSRLLENKKVKESSFFYLQIHSRTQGHRMSKFDHDQSKNLMICWMNCMAYPVFCLHCPWILTFTLTSDWQKNWVYRFWRKVETWMWHSQANWGYTKYERDHTPINVGYLYLKQWEHL